MSREVQFTDWPTRAQCIQVLVDDELAGLTEQQAEDAVDALVNAVMLMPAERYDEDCHACGALVRDHLVDGRHPRPIT